MNRHRKIIPGDRALIRDDNAVLGLPMRLTVSIIIGTVALAAILAFMLNPCLFPGKLVVSVSPLVHEIPPDQNSTNLTLFVSVTGMDGHPLSGATVRITGLGGTGSGVSDQTGKTTVPLTVTLGEGSDEGYLDVVVKAACRTSFSQLDMIKVVRRS